MTSRPENLPEGFEIDPQDNLIRAIVGPWAYDKHARIRKYVDISGPARRKYAGQSQSTFIDLFCSCGRSRIKDTQEVIDGSPVVAWLESVRCNAPFSKVLIADHNEQLLKACEARLLKHGAPVVTFFGDAQNTVDALIRQLDPHGLHFILLDPYNLESLSFGIVRKLAALKRADILMHVSAVDLQMNLRLYMSRDTSPLDSFAPGWRAHVPSSSDDVMVRGKILEHWRNLLKLEGLTTTETHQLVVGSGNQRLYWLAFAAKHELALSFWDKIKHVGPEQRTLL